MRKRIISAVVVLGLGMVGIAPAQQVAQPSKNPDSKRANEPRLTPNVISAIRFEGTGPSPGANIRRAFLSQVGQPLDQDRQSTDARTLMRTKWYSSVEAYYEESPRKSGRAVLTFVVRAKEKSF